MVFTLGDGQIGARPSIASGGGRLILAKDAPRAALAGGPARPYPVGGGPGLCRPQFLRHGWRCPAAVQRTCGGGGAADGTWAERRRVLVHCWRCMRRSRQRSAGKGGSL